MSPIAATRVVAWVLFCGGAVANAGTVRVYLNMHGGAQLDDPQRHLRVVQPREALVRGIGVYVVADEPGLLVQSMGYFGGLDRGLAFGHVQSNSNIGQVAELLAHSESPIVPGAFAWAEPQGGFMKVFDGPEVQYLEGGGEPAAVSTVPHRLFVVDVRIAGAAPCDRFAFHVMDAVTAWRGGVGGVFTTTEQLDTGGDSVADGTRSTFGVDADVPTTPGGTFVVDYIDGPAGGGPALILVTYAGDIDLDGDVDLTDLALLLANFGSSCGISGICTGDVDGDADVDLTDLATVLRDFGRSCN